MILLIIIAIRLAIWATVAMVWITVYFLYAVIIATVYIVGFTALTVKYLYDAWRSVTPARLSSATSTQGAWPRSRPS